MATSDGISTRDWEHIEILAQEIAEISSRDADTKLLKAQIINTLGWMETKYGRLPSIVATMADYVDNEKLEIRLLKEAYCSALEIQDSKNVAYISASLAEFYLDREGEKMKLVFWTSKLGEALVDYSDSYLSSLFQELKQ